MKFEKIHSILKGIPYIDPGRAKDLYDYILAEKPTRCLELGMAHGVSSCYMAAALDEIGKGHLVSVDLIAAMPFQKPSIEDLLLKTGLGDYVTVVREHTSYNWFLKKEIEKYSKENSCDPAYDFCFIDGSKNWTIDGFAFFLVDKLLKPGGGILFDDFQWTYEKTGRTETDFINHLEMGEDELTKPHVEQIFRLLVMQHPNYTDFRIQENTWAWAFKKKTKEREETRESKREPSFSVLILSSNSADTRETLENLLPKLREKDEVGVICFGLEGKENVFENFESFAKDRRIQFYCEEAMNEPDAYNQAILKTKNPWILWLRDGDSLTSQTLDKYREKICEDSDIGGLYGNLKILDAAEVETLYYDDFFERGEWFLENLLKEKYPPHSGIAIRKDVYEQFGFYNISFDFAYDYEFWFRIAGKVKLKNVGDFTCSSQQKKLSLGTAPNKYCSKVLKKYLAQYSLEDFFPRLVAGTQDKSRSYRKIGRTFESWKDYPSAIAYFLKSVEVSETRESLYEIFSFYLRLSKWRQYREEIPKFYIKRAVQILEQETNLTSQERYQLASYYKKESFLEKAQEIFLELFRVTNKEHLRGGAAFHLGEINFAQERYEEASMFFNECLHYLPEHMKAKKYIEQFEKYDEKIYS